jgi:formylmethanofuran dehydrogenase subunit D
LLPKASKLSVTLLTGRTIDQGAGKEHGKSSDEYMENVAVCFVDSEDLKRLGMKYNANVCVSTKQGSVVLKALKSQRGPHMGVVFIPYGPWANILVSPETDDIGMPSYKGIPASIEPAPEKQVLSFHELLVQQFRKE